jgi:hypothetical protein
MKQRKIRIVSAAINRSVTMSASFATLAPGAGQAILRSALGAFSKN